MVKIDLRWKVPKKNQLWLKWGSVSREGNGIIKLKDAEFFGPVLSDCEPIEHKGFINIDLTKHFVLLIPAPYIVKLSWDSLVCQDHTSAKFLEMVIEDKTLGHLDNKLSSKDFILLDATGHTTEDESKGKYKYSFEGMVYNSSMEPYNFGK